MKETRERVLPRIAGHQEAAMEYSFTVKIVTKTAISKDYFKLMFENKVRNINISPLEGVTELPVSADIQMKK